MIDGVARGLWGWHKPQGQSLARPDTEMIEDTNMGNEQDVGWVSVYIVWDNADAVMIVARLQDEGIPALARPEAASSAIPVAAGMLGEIEILVPEAMVDHALDVLWNLGLLTEDEETDEYYEE